VGNVEDGNAKRRLGRVSLGPLRVSSAIFAF
jgi:hypothetical protein